MPLLLRVTFVSLAVVGVTAAPVKVPLPKREHPLVRPAARLRRAQQRRVRTMLQRCACVHAT